MLTTAGAARSTASAYECTARDASVDAGCAVTGAGLAGRVTGRGDSRAGAGPAGGGARRVISSGRTITTMKAAASPTIAETETNVRILRIGRFDIAGIFLVGRRL